MAIAVGSDHAGVTLKAAILDTLTELAIPYHDFGVHDNRSTDYPDIAQAVAKAVAGGEYERGIIVCGTGIGVSITANKVHGIRAALCHDTYSARMSREHNDANILCLGSRIVGVGLATEIVRVWLSTSFSKEERHARRVGKIGLVEDKG